MAKSNNNLKSVLQDTADAIRTKTGASTPISPRDFADEITNIPAGGEGDSVYDSWNQTLTKLNSSSAYFIPQKGINYQPFLSEISFPNCYFLQANAIQGCNNLQTLYLPNLVAGFRSSSTGNYSLNGCISSCYGLRVISLPNCYLDPPDIRYCSNLEEIHMPNFIGGITSRNIFDNNSKVSVFDVPFLRSIGDGTRFENTFLSANLTFNMLSYIGTSALGYNNGLDSFECRGGEVLTVGTSAFCFCHYLKSFMAYDATLYTYCFYSCWNLSTITMGRAYLGYSRVYPDVSGNVSSIVINLLDDVPPNLHSQAFGTLTKGRFYVPSEALESYKTATNWASYSDRIYSLDESFYSKYVMAHEFKDNGQITSYPSERDVEVILPGGFYSCPNLTTISASNVKTICREAFRYCSSLSEVSLPNCELTGSRAFGNCNLTSIYLPKCKIIGPYMCESMTTLTSVNLPECEFLGAAAFSGCYNLTSVSLPKCKYVMEGAFINCSSLSVLDLPECEAFLGALGGATPPPISSLSLPKCKVFMGIMQQNYFPSKKVFLPECLTLGSITAPRCFSGFKSTTFVFPKLQVIYPYALAGLSGNCSIYILSPNHVNYNGWQWSDWRATDSYFTVGSSNKLYVRASLVSWYASACNGSQYIIGLTDEEVEQILNQYNN